jgi:calcium-dependent protein kinase
LAQLSGRYHKEPRTIDSDYDVTETVLGSGCNGDVRLATSKSYPSHKFAVKDFNFAGVPLSKREQLECEVEVFLSMDHPHIARLMDVYEQGDHISLVMEHMEGGELFDRLARLKRFGESEAASAAWHMLMALNYIHSHGIMHGDVKLENFMFDMEGGNHLKLIDFGFSKMCEGGGLSATGQNGGAQNKQKLCGTVAYIAPEALELSYSSQNDQWSLGVVVFVLLAGYMPFSGSQSCQMKKIAKGDYLIKEDRWSTVSPDATAFVKGLLELDPAKRLSAQTALDHPFITKGRFQSKVDVDGSIVTALRDFGQQSAFRRCVLCMIAWSLSNEERAQVEEAFLTLDASHHGTITFGDLKKVMVDKFHLPNGELKKAFHALDTHHDKEIHYSDFLAAMLSTQIGINDEHVYEAFRKFDTHDAGYITVEDLREVLGDTVEGERVESFIWEADPLRQGYITYHEFVSYVRGRPLHLHGDEMPTDGLEDDVSVLRDEQKRASGQWLELLRTIRGRPCHGNNHKIDEVYGGLPNQRSNSQHEPCCTVQ